MLNRVNLKCFCGKVKGTLKIVPKEFFHVHCLCCDCQTFATRLNNENIILDEHGGSELFQTYPANIEITEGHDSIACMQIMENGLYRWYAACCNMPLANTTKSSKVPFVGMSVKFMQFENDQEKMAMLGPVILKAFGQYSIGERPKDVHPKFPVSFLPKIMGFMLKGMLKKKQTPSPFFNNNGPIVKAVVSSE